MRLRTIQGLLVIGAIAWAIHPFYGGAAFVAAYLLLLFAFWRAGRRARKAVAGQSKALEAQLTPEALGWISQNALFYVAPKDAAQWATTFGMTVLLMLLAGPAVVLHSLVFLKLQALVMLVPVALTWVLSTKLSSRLKVDDRVNEGPDTQHKGLHDEARKVLGLRQMAGQWPPKS